MTFSSLDYTVEADHQIFWLAYWIIFCSINFISPLIDYLDKVIPFYYVLKATVYIALFHP